MAGKLEVHECKGVSWKVYKVELEPDWESHWVSCMSSSSWAPHSTSLSPLATTLSPAQHGNASLAWLMSGCSYSFLCFCPTFLFNIHLLHSCSPFLALGPFMQEDAQEFFQVLVGRTHKCVAIALTMSSCSSPPVPYNSTGLWWERAESTFPNARTRVGQSWGISFRQ